MASLALQSSASISRSIVTRVASICFDRRPTARDPLTQRHARPASLAAALALGISTTILHDLWDSVLRAVPKKKTTHSKTRMRSATKGLKDKLNINNCSACGQPKLANTLCGSCYREVRHRWAKEASGAAGIGSA
ncbi:hypothetical protein BCR37DRAFT_377608 [Protomyces lactucae-debilis]|uniref:Large ribosomal subunit protein bL32m n=1 Tax=Protomyces lactucae-debilis TaxID=2754530 RepID=A0A1Y2FML1_PROLT|nr:uncharacterized protein BCR37DRAFT_377608 [Protomyces lactucae-debilis]ORY84827.1 hypothetical protein BCR37DRAFT_377608 [Protomyces lactucae-debilis]